MLLLAAAQQTGLLEALVKAIMEVADPTIPGLSPPNPAVIARLVLTLLFLPVAGLREHVGFARLYGNDVGEAFRA